MAFAPYNKRPPRLQSESGGNPDESARPPHNENAATSLALGRGTGTSGALRREGARGSADAAGEGRLRDVLAPQAEAGELGVGHAVERVVTLGERDALAQAIGEITEEPQEAETPGGGTA